MRKIIKKIFGTLALALVPFAALADYNAHDIGRYGPAVAATAGQIPILQTNGVVQNTSPAFINASAGGVVGPASATSTALVRFNGSTGKLIQNSVDTVATSGEIFIPATTNQLNFGSTNTTTISSVAPSASRVITIPDAGADSNIILSQGAQTIAGVKTFSDNVTMGVAAKGLVLKTGANGKVGTFICTSGGTISVSNTSVAASDFIGVSLNTVGGTVSTAPAIATLTASTGFSAKCATSDTSTYNYAIISNQ